MSGDRNDAEIFKLLRDHESHIASLQTDVSGIKGAVHQQGVILQEIRSTLAEQKAGRGPGLLQVLGGAAMCCGVLGAAAAAITVLVSSQFAPGISEMKTSLGAGASVVHRIEEDRACSGRVEGAAHRQGPASARHRSHAFGTVEAFGGPAVALRGALAVAGVSTDQLRSRRLGLPRVAQLPPAPKGSGAFCACVRGFAPSSPWPR